MAQHRTRRPSQQQQQQRRRHPPPSTSLHRRAQKSSSRLSSRPTAALSSATKEAASIMRRSNRPLRRTAASSLVSSLAARSVLALASVLLVLASISSASAAAASVSSTDALFDALDSDHDGMISRRDFDSSVATIAGALGVEIGTGGGGGGDDAAGDDEGEGAGGAGGEEEGGDDGLVQMVPNGGEAADANTAASDVQNRNAQAARRDGLTGEIRPGGRAFNPGRAAKPKKAKTGNKDKPKKLSFTKAFASSVAMILATEIGDKTFFIAAVLSMRNDRLAVFGGAILALIVMTILSTMMGLVLPSILPRRYTHIIGGLLFLYFGIKLVLDSRTMEDKVSDELEEVEEELGVQGGGGAASKKEDEEDVSEYGTDTDVENGTGTGARKRRSKHDHASSAPKRTTSGLAGATAYSSTNVQKIFLQALTLTFLAEWGDRSQIATIALAAAKDPLGVTVGGCVGHSMCTGMAVAGGRMLASRISERTVSFWGGIIFNVFGVHSLFFER